MPPDIAQWTVALGVAGPLLAVGLVLFVAATKATTGSIRHLERSLRAEEERNDRLEQENDELRRRIGLLEQTLRMKSEPWTG